jgi:hypothetical protein
MDLKTPVNKDISNNDLNNGELTPIPNDLRKSLMDDKLLYAPKKKKIAISRIENDDSIKEYCNNKLLKRRNLPPIPKLKFNF